MENDEREKRLQELMERCIKESEWLKEFIRRNEEETKRKCGLQ